VLLTSAVGACSENPRSVTESGAEIWTAGRPGKAMSRVFGARARRGQAQHGGGGQRGQHRISGGQLVADGQRVSVRERGHDDLIGGLFPK
jgi:hypothetical protein